MSKKFILLPVICSCLVHSFGQNEDDALRYSMTYFGGSARNVATAGSFGAVGGDYSFLSSNPAGLGRYKKHIYSFTGAVENPMATADFYGTEAKESGFALKGSNISHVKVYNLDPTKYNNWYGVQAGLGYNRIASFQDEMHYTGSSDSSILHSFIRMANGTPPDQIYAAFPFDAGLAYDTYALDPDPSGGNNYVTDFTSGMAIHDRTITRKGGMGEYSFMISANYGNKLLIGGSFNITRAKYTDNYEHKETYTDQSLWIRDIRYLTSLSVKGFGYGACLGVIYLPYEWLRIGVSAQTATFFRLADRWSANFYTNSDDGLKYVDEANVPSGNYDYNVRTPFRANVSLGLVSKKYGSIGADVEFVDYSSALLSSRKFSEAPYHFLSENAQIGNIYRSVFNYKIGGEFHVKKQYYVRGGYANYASPYEAGKGNAQHAVQFITGGLGYNRGDVYVDVAAMTKLQTSDYYAYDPTMNGSHVVIDYRNVSYLLTLGFRLE